MDFGEGTAAFAAELEAQVRDATIELSDPPCKVALQFADYFAGRDMQDRNTWYVLRGQRPMAFGSGIHGQNLWVLPQERIVIAKLSSRPKAQDEAVGALHFRMIESVKRHLVE